MQTRETIFRMRFGAEREGERGKIWRGESTPASPSPSPPVKFKLSRGTGPAPRQLFKKKTPPRTPSRLLEEEMGLA